MTVPSIEAGKRVRSIPVIGIVGGIGSGKSAVVKWAAARTDSEVVDADQLGHAALREQRVKDALIQRFGPSILTANGEIDRSALAKLVFGAEEKHREARHALEQIVHPEIGRKIVERIDSAAAQGRTAVLLDAAVLLEANWRIHCDIVVFIDTPDEIRLARVREHRGWSEDELRRRESSQLSLAEKRNHANMIVRNDSTLDLAGEQLLNLIRQKGLTNSKSPD